MTNEEFQKLVINKLGNLEVSMKDLEKGQKDLEVNMKDLEKGQKYLEVNVKELVTGQKNLETSIKDLETGQLGIRKDIESIVEQTADLTEFREEVKDKLETLIQENLSIHGILGEHEVAIRTLRRRVI